MKQSNAEFWAAIRKSAERVRGLPAWTQGGIVLSDNFEGGKSKEASVATVSDEMVEQVALAISDALFKHNIDPSLAESEDAARAAIAALSTPEFVLPLAEEMLRGIGTSAVDFAPDGFDDDDLPVALFVGSDSNKTRLDATLLDAYRAAKGE